MLTWLIIVAFALVTIRTYRAANRKASTRLSASRAARGASITAASTPVYAPGDSATYALGNAPVYAPGDSATYAAGNAPVYAPGDSATYAPAPPITAEPEPAPPEPSAAPAVLSGQVMNGRETEIVLVELERDDSRRRRRRYEGSAAISSTALDTTLATPYQPSSLTSSSLSTSL